MLLWEKIKESAISVVPVMALIWLIHLTVAPMGATLHKFFIGGVLLILGLGLFLLGTEVGIVPTGRQAGSALTQRRNLPLLLISGFIIGFFITVAEPDVHVLAQQVRNVDPQISSTLLVIMIAAGVGLFVAIALARVVFQLSLRLLLACFYLVVLICAFFTYPSFLGIAFDAGGATTGPMTVPFILALGIGVAAVRAKASNDDSFGLIGIASIGPILSVLVLGFFTSESGIAPEMGEEHVALSLWEPFYRELPLVAQETALALAPLVALFAVFRLTLFLHMPASQLLRIIMGLIYTYIGIVSFFVGVKAGFIPAGTMLGALLSSHDSPTILLVVSFALGALAVCAEPAVWVLTNQVEVVSRGAIKSRLILIFLCVGVASAVALSVARLILGWPLWTFLLPGYILAFFLSLFSPPMFTAIAFDSGGVASGPMASTFILAFTLGAAGQLGTLSVVDAFGAIALIAMTPLIALQLLGILFKIRTRRKN